MKLNYSKTFLLGFGFFGVSVIWGIYNAFVPIFLSEKFNLAPALIGFFMTLDNIAALLIQPPVGAWSDRLRTPVGRRTGLRPHPPRLGPANFRRLHQHPAAQHGPLAHPGCSPDA